MAKPPIQWEAWLGGLLLCVATFVVVFGGVVFGASFLRQSQRGRSDEVELIGAFCNWDGRNYLAIADHGYDYKPDERGKIVQYPAYPVAGRLLAQLTGLRTDLALLIVSNLCFAAACAALGAYVADPPDRSIEGEPSLSLTHSIRAPAPIDDNQSAIDKLDLAFFAVLSLCLFPTTFFARMAYTEGMFVLWQALALWGLRRGWPLWLVAVIVGAATATRPVGVALLLPLIWHIVHGQATGPRKCLQAVGCGTLGCWGVAAYMLYQHLQFGDPLAFVKNNAHWHAVPAIGWREHLLALVTLKPVWQVYVPSSPAFWLRVEQHAEAGLSLSFANPVFFVLAVALLIAGYRRRWIGTGELLLAAGLLAIPYCAKSYDMAFHGMGRFVGAIVPLHIVIGHILARMPAPLAAVAVALSTALMAAYAAMFAAGYTIV